MMRHKCNYWWVNQGKETEPRDDVSLISAPRQTERKQEVYYWTNVSRIKRGDVLFHYRHGYVFAESVAKHNARPWRRGSGWMVECRVIELEKPIALSRISASIRRLRLCRGPLMSDGRVKSGYVYRLDHRAAKIIRKHIQDRSREATLAAIEGIVRETEVLQRSRNRALRQKALDRARGKCEACKIDYRRRHFGRGARVLQVHHRRQLSESLGSRRTRLDDLAVLCANCHVLVHVNVIAV